MALQQTKLYKKWIRSLCLTGGILFLLSGCNLLKYVPEDEYLLNKVSIQSEERLAVTQDDLREYLKQRPNKRLLGVRFYLWLYNRSDEEKTNRWNEWLRNNSEQPVLWDASLNEKTKDQFLLFFTQKGYYHAQVADSLKYHRRRKVDVTYHVDAGWPYTVRQISYDIADTAIRNYVVADTLHSVLHRGMILDSDVLKSERERIKTMLMDKGYFGFSEYAILFEVDTVSYPQEALVTLKIQNTPQMDANGVQTTPSFPVFKIREVTVNAELDYGNLLGNTSSSSTSRAVPDTLRRSKYTFLMNPSFPVKSSTLAQSIFVVPDSLYRLSEANRTCQHLMNLQTFKLVNVQFKEVDTSTTTTSLLDCQINLLPFKMQHYGIEVEGTNSGGNIGGAVNFVYQHKSLFHHAEIFDMKIITMAEAIQQEGIDFNSTYEYGIEAGITIPKFILPFLGVDRFVKRYNPRTSISSQFNYQLRPDYKRTIANISLTYNWNSGKYMSHSVRPIDINFVRLPFISERFNQQIEGTYLENSYTNHMVAAGSYTFSYNNKTNTDKRDFMFFRANFETAGLLLNAYSALFQTNEEKPYRIFANAYSQFFKIDADYRFYQRLSNNSRLVYRLMAAVGVPYGNSQSIPFERKYYAGGANSLRGWKVRTLGPGSFQDTIPQMYPNSTGDIKLEANLEYRFKMFWIVEGALFFDVGNVWDFHKDDKRPGADFAFDRFFKELAMSAGLGFRFDASFFIFRTDIGLKLRDPALDAPWNPIKQWRGLKDLTLSIGIGYPF